MRVVRKHRPPVNRTCAGCGKGIVVLACRTVNVATSYFSTACRKALTQTIRTTPLTRDRLLEMLSYDPDTGVFRWRVSPKHRSGKIKPGDIAGTKRSGYVRILIDGKLHSAHRLAWLYVYGEWPSNQMDHRDLNRANNAIANLRPATQQQNQWNTRVRRTSQTGVKGVQMRDGKFCVRIMRNGRRVVIGRFKSIDEARDAYLQVAADIHGEFIRHTAETPTTTQATA